MKQMKKKLKYLDVQYAAKKISRDEWLLGRKFLQVQYDDLDDVCMYAEGLISTDEFVRL